MTNHGATLDDLRAAVDALEAPAERLKTLAAMWGEL